MISRIVVGAWTFWMTLLVLRDVLPGYWPGILAGVAATVMMDALRAGRRTPTEG